MAEIDDRIDELETKHRLIGQEIAVLRQKRALDACPYKVGQVMVLTTSGRKGQRARITAITPDYNRAGYRLRGAVLKQDGTDGKRTTELYGFEEWKPEEA